ANGFYPAETTLRISLPLSRWVRQHPTAVGRRRARLRPATADDLPTLVKMVDGMFTRDRFHLDPHLPADRCDRRYAQWLERGFADGDYLFVYAADSGEAMGFYLLRGEPGGDVDLSLAGVDERYRRGGAGALMYDEVVQRCREMGFRTASSTISTNNLDVVNLFLRLGFVIRSSQLTMHLFRP
ncbi:MAG: N-acetyltransferase family protein, partial [Micromonosporaceae bacterium]